MEKENVCKCQVCKMSPVVQEMVVCKRCFLGIIVGTIIDVGDNYPKTRQLERLKDARERFLRKELWDVAVFPLFASFRESVDARISHLEAAVTLANLS